ncbi:MAG: NAD-glutamate dehydrogenase [Gammaproteobacteria bacterium]|nr:NAD-glutamate dehydrogenase [Gammaproteobacteria bacterium]
MKNSVTESLISALKEKSKHALSPKDIGFLKVYFHRLSGQDFNLKQAPSFKKIAFQHRELGRIRRPGKTLITISNEGGNEAKDTSGKGSVDTIITIVTEDRPFIVNSVAMKLNNINKTPLSLLHPIFSVSRGRDHHVIDIEKYHDKHSESLAKTSRKGKSDVKLLIESYIQIRISYTPESEHRALSKKLKKVIDDIAIVYRDWKAMRHHTAELAMLVESDRKGPVFAEYGAFFDWMTQNHFAFLGYCELEVTQQGTKKTTLLDNTSLLGVLKAVGKNEGNDVLEILPPIIFSATSPVIFTKSRQCSTIHRPSHMDCILFDHGFEPASKSNDAEPIKRRKVSCILGFLSGSSAMLPTPSIPHLRNKTNYVLTQSGLRPGGYGYKRLRTTLETLPRSKLFQMDIKSLYSLCMTLLNQERRKTRVHLHQNLCGHFYSCLVYIPKDLFNSGLRQRIQDYLSEQLDAYDVSFDVYFSESILTRIHYIIHRSTPAIRTVDHLALEADIQEMAKDWDEQLNEALRVQYGNDEFIPLLEKFRNGFGSAYREDFTIDTAVTDLAILPSLAEGKLHASLGHSVHAAETDTSQASFKIYSLQRSIPLSDVLPILENMGARVLGERPYQVSTKNGDVFKIHDFVIVRKDGGDFDFQKNSTYFESTFIQCSKGKIENDGYNQLTLSANLDWRQISLIRAYYKYLKQIRLRYSENYIIDALVSNPQLALTISQLFDARFNPQNQTTRQKVKKGAQYTPKRVSSLVSKINTQLETVSTIDEDRIIRALIDVVNATLRTNYFQLDEQNQFKSYISIKLDSGSIPRIPEPHPKFEVFIYSPRVEGVHLRGGKVARGGLRWSERPEDFRTEVLGLVKAQRVKNAVIVPVGSKGGFVAKELPTTGRADIHREVIECYKIFISGLLDITDNLMGDKVIPPIDVVRLDVDDPYLVVAADKGTATFSDIANGISQDYGFWLGDAFASGGSVGYDHKKMGITARGAWESVKRHFRERGKNIMTTNFTVVGIGDMGGDVFGNGMLLSKHIQLVAAFNHMHIFIDPNPVAASSYLERKRLFNLQGSSWIDYDEKLISQGGGLYSRDLKSIEISAQASEALGIPLASYTPNELINLILKSPIELLWNGGIGTYVKASTETHEDAQDRANDGLRVNANELGCKVVGEGGNLGMTQLGRVEFNQSGGLCYTDAIDNSAGVDTSDHEVNIKILLNAAMQDGKLSAKERNATLAKMEKEIARLVLNNNYIQTQILSVEATFGVQHLLQHSRIITILEEKGQLNRSLEYLPDNQTLQERREAGTSLTRPELAVLLSYSKMDLYQSLLDSDLPESHYLAPEIVRYFPVLLGEKYPQLIQVHRLKKEIISTQIANELVGSMGPSFHLRLSELTGDSAEKITRSYIAARDILATEPLRLSIQSLDNKVEAKLQSKCLHQMSQVTEASIVWILRNTPEQFDLQQLVDRFDSSSKALSTKIENSTSPVIIQKHESLSNRWHQQGLPKPLAKRFATFTLLNRGLDITDIAIRTDTSIEAILDIYFQLSELLGFHWLQETIESLSAKNVWHERAQFSLGIDLRTAHTDIVINVLKTDESASSALRKWRSNYHEEVIAIRDMAENMKEEGQPDFAMLSVVVSELSRLR